MTGATGYIGRRLVATATASGRKVIAATRRPDQGASAWTPYSLDQPPDPAAIPRGARVIHLAARTAGSADDGIELRAAQQLCDASREREATLLFVSSQTARPDAPTAYGRTKWAIEQVVLRDAASLVVRPGLVYGGPPGGLYATLLHAVERSPLIPMPMPAPRVQPVHLDDLVEVLLGLADARPTRQVWQVGAAVPVPFDRFLTALAEHRGGAVPCMLRLPRPLFTGAATCMRMVGARATAARVTSLLDLPPMLADDVGVLGVHLRAWEQGARGPRPGRRPRIAEANTLLGYVLGTRPGHRMVRRYVRAVEASATSAPLSLPGWTTRAPWLLRILDRPATRRVQPLLAARIDAAAAIAEADPQGAPVFLRAGPSKSPFTSLLRLAWVGLIELLAGAVGFIVRIFGRAVPSPSPRSDE